MTAVGLRGLTDSAATSASDAQRSKVLDRVWLAGLAGSGAVLVGELPRITRAGGMGTFFGDAFAHGWTLVLVTVAAGSVRTFTWRAYVGAGLTGLLAVSALVRLVGDPLYRHFGPDSLLEGAVIGPAVEELCKALPLVLIGGLAARRRDVRPSALDLTLLGMWVGAGFALYEDAMFGRGGVRFGSALPVSLFFPTVDTVDGLSQVGAGHLMYTGIVGLGLGVGVLYRRRWRLAWLAVPGGCFVAFAEHASWNGRVGSAWAAPSWVGLLSGVTMSGRLSAFLLIGAIPTLVVFEWRRATRGGPRVAIPRWLWLPAAESRRRGAWLAVVQCGARQDQVTSPKTGAEVGGPGADAGSGPDHGPEPGGAGPMQTPDLPPRSRI